MVILLKGQCKDLVFESFSGFMINCSVDGVVMFECGVDGVQIGCKQVVFDCHVGKEILGGVPVQIFSWASNEVAFRCHRVNISCVSEIHHELSVEVSPYKMNLELSLAVGVVVTQVTDEYKVHFQSW